MENRGEFLRQDKIRKADIMDKVFASHNYNGFAA